MPTPLAATFGLSQRDRLQSASENAYRIALERMFRSRLIFRLEEQLEANRTNPGFLYEALKVYLMLGRPAAGGSRPDQGLDAARLGRQPLSRRRQRRAARRWRSIWSPCSTSKPGEGR